MPDTAAVKKQYEIAKEKGLLPAFPYWAKLWPSSMALARFLLQHPQYTSGKKVLEIAAGLGLPSLVAASTAASVLCTDMAEEAMEVAAKSAALAGLQNMQCVAMNWNDMDANITADTVLLSDVNYEPEVFESLYNVMQTYLRNGSTILLATPQRLMAVPFITLLEPFTQQQCTITEVDEYDTHQITLLALSYYELTTTALPA